MEDALPARLAVDLERAFEDLVRTHQHMVFGVALRVTSNRSDAEDVAQETFVRAYRALGEYDGDRAGAMRLRPWLARIAVNLAKNKVRRQRRPEPLDVDPVDLRRGPEEAAMAGASGALTAAALARLPERYRTVVALRHIEGLGYGEVAEALDRPVGTVKAQVHRGLALLRAQMEQLEEGAR